MKSAVSTNKGGTGSVILIVIVLAAIAGFFLLNLRKPQAGNAAVRRWRD